MCDKKQHQPALSISEQISNLKSIGLIIDDEKRAASILNDISYFRLIKAYSLTLKERNSNYPEGVTFDQIVQLYLFNANFRQLLFTEIEQIEVNLRCRVSNYCSKQHGIFGYKDSEFFIDPERHENLLKDINREINRNYKAPFIRNFKNNYDPPEVPFYAAIEVFTFGTLSKFFKNLHNDFKRDIAKVYGIKYTYLESWFESLSYVRNICAHYGRLYNAKLAKTPILYNEYKEKGIGNLRVFGLLCCMKHLLPNDRHWIEFIAAINGLFLKYPAAKKETMGFPDNWQEILSEQ